MILCMPSCAEDGPYLAYMWQILGHNRMHFAYVWHMICESPGVNVEIPTFPPGLFRLRCHM